MPVHLVHFGNPPVAPGYFVTTPGRAWVRFASPGRAWKRFEHQLARPGDGQDGPSMLCDEATLAIYCQTIITIGGGAVAPAEPGSLGADGVGITPNEKRILMGY